jgi:FeS assembly SUF system protein
MKWLIQQIKSRLADQKPIDPPTCDDLVAALRTVYDPEIPLNIYDLGLIYRLDIDDQGVVLVEMTLTTPACPVAGTLPKQVGSVIDALPGVRDTTVRLVWSPPWSQERMSEAAQMQLGLL